MPRWARAVADHAAATGRPIRLVTVTDASTAGGRSRSQAAAQLARASRRATDDRVAAFAVASRRVRREPTRRRAGRPPRDRPRRRRLSGAELVVGRGWAGLRSHPRPTGTIVLGGTELPDWLDATLRDASCGPMTGRRPARIVDAHVHLWDPARTDWYPYLSGRQEIGHGDTTGMSRRFDIATPTRPRPSTGTSRSW